MLFSLTRRWNLETDKLRTTSRMWILKENSHHWEYSYKKYKFDRNRKYSTLKYYIFEVLYIFFFYTTWIWQFWFVLYDIWYYNCPIYICCIYIYFFYNFKKIEIKTITLIEIENTLLWSTIYFFLYNVDFDSFFIVFDTTIVQFIYVVHICVYIYFLLSPIKISPLSIITSQR